MTPYREDTAAFEDAPFVLGAGRSAVVLTLAYFSLFRHPLREAELLAYTHFYALGEAEGRAAIQDLVDRGILESLEGMLCLRGDSDLVKIRTDRELRAEHWQPRVKRSVRTLSRLPFIRGLFISGSLSKGTQDPDGDIDFLLVTAPNRLWTAQFFATLLSKVMPAHLRRFYCINYFLSQDQLPIPERTLFSATEIAFLKPVMSPMVCAHFFQQNAWIKAFYPNWTPPEGGSGVVPDMPFKRLVEWPLTGTLGDRFEAWISKLFLKRIKRYLVGLPPGRNRSDFRAGPAEFKGHVRGRHESTRQAWHERLHRLEEDLGIRVIRWPWAISHGQRLDPWGLLAPKDYPTRTVMPLKVTSRRVLPPG